MQTTVRSASILVGVTLSALALAGCAQSDAPVDQNRGLASELPGMMDVAEPSAAQVLRPMAEAADAIAAGGRDRPAPELQAAMDHAYDALRQACITAGSSAWE